MKAKFAGKCYGCDTRYSVGAEIEKQGGWRLVGCEVCTRRELALKIIFDIEKRMIEKHQIMYGYDFGGEHPGCKQTGTPREFLEAAIKCGEVTDHEAKEYEFWYRTGGGHGMSMDLSE